MKALNLTLLVIFLLLQNTNKLIGQCNVQIPTNAIVLQNYSVIYDSNQVYWLCENAYIEYHGNNNIIYAEKNTYIENHVVGSSTIIYAKTGTYCECYGTNDTIFYEAGVIIESIPGLSSDSVLCNSLTFDYSNAPTNGCPATTGIDKLYNDEIISVYPNPTNGELFIKLNTYKEKPMRIQTTDLSGNILFELTNTSAEQKINIAQLPTGIYLLRLITDEEIIIKKIIRS